MKILIVAATSFEVAGFQAKYPEADVLITGVGMVATSYALTKKILKNKYDLVVNAGIAGAFNTDTEIGDTFQVTSDCFSELGAEDNNNFISLFEMGFVDKNSFPFKDGVLQNSFVIDNFKQAKAITVNKVHGEQLSINKAIKHFNADIESMEGAAVFFVCLNEGLPCLQIRTISNYVEPRNKDNWNIPLAIDNLNKSLISVYEQYILYK